MKKIFSLFIAMAMAASLFAFAGCGEKREDVLKIYNAGDYIAEDSENGNVIQLFEEYYRNKTGNNNFKVIYDTFDNNENAIIKLEKNKEDWDLVNVSDYAVEKLAALNLLKKIDTSLIDNFKYVSPYIKEQYKKIMTNTKEQFEENETYAVGYMWGTMGILYNTAASETITEEVKSWSALWDSKYYNKILMKNSVRDSYAIALLYANRDELNSLTGTDKLNKISNLLQTSTDDSVAQAEKALKSQRELVNVRYEVDDGKDDIARGAGYIMSLAWSGDAGFAISSANEGVELDYSIPEEGSNVWFDGWTMPIYGVNNAAAIEFINFMCDPEVAIRNMNATGYSSVLASPEIIEWHLDYAEEIGRAFPTNVKYFFGEIEGYDTESLPIDPVFIADVADIERCGIMSDFGDQTDNVLKMFTRVKGSELSTLVIVILLIAVIGGVSAGIYFNLKKSKKRKITSKRKSVKK